MDVMNHLFAALGRLLLSVSSVLVIEELTLGGLARLLISTPYDSRTRRRRTMRTRRRLAPRNEVGNRNKALQGEAPCSQSNTY
jgi:hypothetical protein